MPRTTVRLMSRTRLVAVSLGTGVAAAVLAGAAAAGALPPSASDVAHDTLARVGIASHAGGSQTGREHRAPKARPKPFATTTSSSSSSSSAPAGADDSETTSGAPATTTSTTSTTRGHRGDDNASDTAKEHADESSAVHGDKPHPTGRGRASHGPDEHAADAATDAPHRSGRTTRSTTPARD